MALHAAARPPRTDGTVRVSLTAALFRMERADEPAARRSPRSRPAFRYFFASRAVNLAGSMMAPIALAFAVLAIEDSATALGQVLAARSVPMVLPAARRGDRRPGRPPPGLQVSNASPALSQGPTAVLVITGHAELWHLVALEAVNGALRAASSPRCRGCPQLVPRAQLQSANVLLSMARGADGCSAPRWGAARGRRRPRLGARRRRRHLAGRRGPAAAGAATRRPGAGAHRARVVDVPTSRGLDAVPRHHLALGGGAGFGVLNAIHAGAWFTLGPAVARDTIGVAGWGWVLSAESVGGLLLATVVLLRVAPLRRCGPGCSAARVRAAAAAARARPARRTPGRRDVR